MLGDVRGPNAHQRGHLPGSIPLVLGSPPPLATRETVQEFAVEVQRRLGRHGVTGEERLVLYDRGDCVGAAASQQAALVAGHPQVSVLAGGVAAWPGELEQGAVELQKTKTAARAPARGRADLGGAARAPRRREPDDPRRPQRGRVPRPRRLSLRPAPGPHPRREAPRGRAPLRRARAGRTSRGASASSPGCPRARRSSPTATRARARPSPRWRSEPPATTRATTRARGTSGRATTTCLQSAERGLRAGGPARASELVLLLLGLRLQDLDLVARHRGDALVGGTEPGGLRATGPCSRSCSSRTSSGRRSRTSRSAWRTCTCRSTAAWRSRRRACRSRRRRRSAPGRPSCLRRGRA